MSRYEVLAYLLYVEDPLFLSMVVCMYVSWIPLFMFFMLLPLYTPMLPNKIKPARFSSHMLLVDVILCHHTTSYIFF